MAPRGERHGLRVRYDVRRTPQLGLVPLESHWKEASQLQVLKAVLAVEMLLDAGCVRDGLGDLQLERAQKELRLWVS